jgi:hypothetical protein
MVVRGAMIMMMVMRTVSISVGRGQAFFVALMMVVVATGSQELSQAYW